MKTIQPK